MRTRITRRRHGLSGLLVAAALMQEAHAAGWQLGPDDGVQWSAPAGQPAESNLLAGAAGFLADTLTSMLGRPVAVVQAPGAPGTGVQLVVEPPAAPPPAEAVFSGTMEAYRIEAAGRVLRISGPTAAGVRNGVMALLDAQGCRWLLPSPRWWVIPRVPRVSFEGRAEGAPSFAYRRIWYAYGAASPALKQAYEVWADANRLGGVASFATGHSYGNIIDRNKREFEAHPEYFAVRPPPTNGPADAEAAAGAAGEDPGREVRDPLKFCYSNPGLRDLCLRDRLALLRDQRASNPYSFMVSMDPSDGPGTCDCEPCRKLGSTTDRVVSLANHVARGLREAMPGAWVGMYAYSTHREPPGLAMESNIHVQVAMAFNKTGYTYEDLIRLWGAKAGSLGIREYYGVEAWDFGMPGRIRGADPAYHRKWLPLYRAAGAVSVSAESNDNWAPQALGFYTAARLLWDVKTDPDAVAADFLTTAFGRASGPMRALYADFASAANSSPGSLARMYALAFEALGAEDDPGVRARIVDVIAYLNYADLFARFERCEAYSGAYFDALAAVMNYAHRIEDRGMVAVYALARRLCNANVKGRRDDMWMFGEDVAWKRGAPLTDDEVLAMASAARVRLAEAAAARVEYSRDLVIRAGPAGAAAPAGRSVPFRHRAVAYLSPLASGSYAFEFGPGITGQLEALPSGPPLASFAPGGTTGAPPPAVSLATGTLYRLTLRTGGSTTTIGFPDGLAVAFEASSESPLWLDSGMPLALYVPAGTDELRCSGDPRLTLHDPSGRRTEVTPASLGEGGFARVAVDARYAARFWTIGALTRGSIAFLNVPPLAQLDPTCALLPRELPAPPRADDHAR